MSFIVKDYDMPQNCGECPCRGYSDGLHYCRVNGHYKDINDISEKPGWCQLADLSEVATVTDCNIYDRETTIHNCAVQILENTVTGKVSIGWYREESDA